MSYYIKIREELSDPIRAGVPGVPDLDSMPVLVEVLTTILFTCTVQHTAVNMGQFESYAFPPNRALHITKPMPDDKYCVTDRYMAASMPDQYGTRTLFSPYISEFL